MERKSVTIRDVAIKAGVSVSTVSRAFNNYDDINADTRQSILEIAKEMGYKPNTSQKSTDPGKYFRVGMVIENYEPSGLLNPLLFDIIMSFKNTASKSGYDVILLSTTSDMQKHQEFERLFNEKQIDGAFVMGLRTSDKYYDEIASVSSPCILHDINIDNRSVCCVGVDNIKGAFMAVEHLIKLGHKKIAFINGHKEAAVSYERLDGYYLALNRYNIPVESSLVYYGDFSDASAERAVEKIMEEHKDVTGVFCASDLMAVGAISMLKNLGYRVPEDVSVVGFDDTYIAAHMSPKLTTIRQDGNKIGETSANVLINLINGQTMDRVLIRPELIIRESTGIKK